VPVDPPAGLNAFVVLDWKDGKIVGLEVLDASALLHPDLLRRPSSRVSKSLDRGM
jgi:uncharacterized protein YuzE